METQQPLKLANLTLYSGDLITLSNSSHLLVEVISEQTKTIKLREVKGNNYLRNSRNLLSKSLSFSADFNKSVNFIIKEDDNSQISLQAAEKYLEFEDGKFCLLPKKKHLTIAKWQFDSQQIINYQEMVGKVDRRDNEKREISKSEKFLIATSSNHDNKSPNPLEINYTFSEAVQEEHKIIWSTDFTLGATARIQLSPSIVRIGAEAKIEEKASNSNIITYTSTRTIQKSTKSTCSSWNKMRIELKANRSEFSIPYTANVKRIIGERTYKYLIDGKYIYDNYYNFDHSFKEITTQNILIVGWTGSGKSTLANVLSKSNDFLVSNESTPKTKFDKKSEEFKWSENYYYVIDNIGFGDTQVEEKEVMLRIGEAINSAYQGLSHVLFVFDGRFTDKEKESLRKLSALKITGSYITLVRSKFDNFNNDNECKADRMLLEKEGKEFSQLLNNCRGLLHINNEDEDSRNDSRAKVLDHLHNSCSRIFKPKEWENIASLIEDYFKAKEKLEKAENQLDIDNLKTATAEQVKEKIRQGQEIKEFVELIQQTELK